MAAIRSCQQAPDDAILSMEQMRRFITETVNCRKEMEADPTIGRRTDNTSGYNRDALGARRIQREEE